MGIMEWLVGWINYIFPILFIIFIIYYVLVARKKFMKRYNDTIDKSLEYSKQTVDLLKEIKDLLKK